MVRNQYRGPRFFDVDLPVMKGIPGSFVGAATAPRMLIFRVLLLRF